MNFSIDRKNFKVRAENNGTMSFLNLKTMNIVFLNKTASILFENSEIQSLEQFVEYMHNKYPTVDKSVLERDCLELLYKMETLEILNIDHNSKTADMEFPCVKVAGEKDFADLSDFLMENLQIEKMIILCSNYDMNHFSAYNLRTRQFNNFEFNFMHYGENRAIDAVITCAINVGATAFSLLHIIGNPDNISILREMLSYIFSVTHNLTKIRVMLQENKFAEKARKIIEQLGFKKEAVLEKEYGDCNVVSLALFRDEVGDK